MKKSWNMTFVSYDLFPEPVHIMVKFKKKYSSKPIGSVSFKEKLKFTHFYLIAIVIL